PTPRRAGCNGRSVRKKAEDGPLRERMRGGAGRSRSAPSAVSRSRGVKPDEMCNGPVCAVPELPRHNRRAMDTIGLWKLNEAFAVQVFRCRDTLGIPEGKLNVSGGAIAVSHPYAMSAAPSSATR